MPCNIQNLYLMQKKNIYNFFSEEDYRYSRIFSFKRHIIIKEDVTWGNLNESRNKTLYFKVIYYL